MRKQLYLVRVRTQLYLVRVQAARASVSPPWISLDYSPSKMHQTGGEDPMQKAHSVALESHRQEQDRKKPNKTSFVEWCQSTDSSQPCSLVSPLGTVSGNTSEKRGTTYSQRKESNDLPGKESEKNTKSPPKTQKTGRQTNTTNSSTRSGTTHSQRKESNDLQGKESEKNTKSPSKTQKTGRQTNTTNSPSKLPLLSQEKAIPLCLPNNIIWDSVTGDIHKTDDERRFLTPVPAAIKMLEAIKEPVAVVSIAGSCRDGKSYILGEVFGGKNVFPIGHYMDPKTVGLWTWIVPEVFQDTSGRDFRVILLDSEGIDAVTAGDQNDNQIFTLTVLLASVLIYNSKGVPKRSDLNSLDFIVNLSKVIRMRSEGGSDDKELFRNTFPFFIWLLRDASNRVPPDCKDINQYFATRVFKESAETTSSEQDRKKVSESILQLFAGFEGFALPLPTTDTEILEDMSNSREMLSPKFFQALKEFKALLKSKLTPKPSVNKGEKITGQALGALVKIYTDALNDPNAIPNVEGAWGTYVKKRCSEAKTRALQIYDQNMTQEMKSAFPCEVEEILEYHQRSQEKSRKIYADETAEFISTYIDKESREFSENVEQQMKAWLDKNASCTRKVCEELLRGLKAEHVDPLLENVRNSRHDGEVKYDDIINQFDTLKDEFAKKAIGAKDVRADVFFKFTEELRDEISKYEEILSKLEDYNKDLAKEKMAAAYQEKMKMKLQEEINQMKKKEEAWEREVTRLVKKQEADVQIIKEQAQEEKKSLEKNLEIVTQANLKLQEKFQGLIQTVNEREQRATQAIMNLTKCLDDERHKGQENFEYLWTKMQNMDERGAQGQEQIQQQLKAQRLELEKSNETIKKFEEKLAKAKEEFLLLKKQKEKLEAKLDEATKPGFLRWIWSYIF